MTNISDLFTYLYVGGVNLVWFDVAQGDLEFVVYVKMTLNYHFSSFSSQVLGLEVCTTMPGLRGALDLTQGFMHARQAPYQLSCIPGRFSYFCDRISSVPWAAWNSLSS